MFAEDRVGGRAGLPEDKQLSKLHLAQMNKHLNTALSLSYLCKTPRSGVACHPNCSTLRFSPRDQLGFSMYSLISLEKQDEEDIEMIG